MAPMKNIPADINYTRFDPETQRKRNRDTRLEAWYLAMVLEDRAETAVPPPELLEEASHG